MRIKQPWTCIVLMLGLYSWTLGVNCSCLNSLTGSPLTMISNQILHYAVDPSAASFVFMNCKTNMLNMSYYDDMCPLASCTVMECTDNTYEICSPTNSSSAMHNSSTFDITISPGATPLPQANVMYTQYFLITATNNQTQTQKFKVSLERQSQTSCSLKPWIIPYLSDNLMVTEDYTRILSKTLHSIINFGQSGCSPSQFQLLNATGSPLVNSGLEIFNQSLLRIADVNKFTRNSGSNIVFIKACLDNGNCFPEIAELNITFTCDNRYEFARKKNHFVFNSSQSGSIILFKLSDFLNLNNSRHCHYDGGVQIFDSVSNSLCPFFTFNSSINETTLMVEAYKDSTNRVFKFFFYDSAGSVITSSGNFTVTMSEPCDWSNVTETDASLTLITGILYSDGTIVNSNVASPQNVSQFLQVTNLNEPPTANCPFIYWFVNSSDTTFGQSIGVYSSGGLFRNSTAIQGRTYDFWFQAGVVSNILLTDMYNVVKSSAINRPFKNWWYKNYQLTVSCLMSFNVQDPYIFKIDRNQNNITGKQPIDWFTLVASCNNQQIDTFSVSGAPGTTTVSGSKEIKVDTSLKSGTYTFQVTAKSANLVVQPKTITVNLTLLCLNKVVAKPSFPIINIMDGSANIPLGLIDDFIQPTEVAPNFYCPIDYNATQIRGWTASNGTDLRSSYFELENNQLNWIGSNLDLIYGTTPIALRYNDFFYVQLKLRTVSE